MSKFTIVKTTQQTWAVVDANGVVVDELATRAKARDLARELTESTKDVDVSQQDVDVNEDIAINKEIAILESIVETNTDSSLNTETISNTEAVEKQVLVIVESVKKVRKSDQVRARIAIAKQNNEADTIVVQWAIDNLGMARQLARVYVKNNWAKV